MICGEVPQKIFQDVFVALLFSVTHREPLDFARELLINVTCFDRLSRFAGHHSYHGCL